ncbi:Gag-Pol polyprotein [Gossypium australe]|uniref:Gag-Pol polyprotein n=1 Tax=Gossypium australe TaxID=47621 RepID=A0A5B6VM80_9ROSI|nr:Gag-Pol polyprotein [Gossypium australe]
MLSVDKIRLGLQIFELMFDDLERAEFWLENSIRVFDELSCTPDECLKCAVSLLRDSAYQWWKTLVSVVSRERVNWEFFQDEFRKKYISQRFFDQKWKEFLELKQGRIKYAQECVSTEAIMCKRFEDGLNEDIRLLVGVLELKEFVVLFNRACKAEELSKEKKKAEFEARDSKKLRDLYARLSASAEYSNGDRGKQYSGSKAQTTSVVSIGNARSGRPECQHCGRQHLSECRMNYRACFKCASQDHFIRDCPDMAEKDNSECKIRQHCYYRETPEEYEECNLSEARALARAYAIRAREEATSPDVITVALIDLGSTHSYVCMKLVASKSMPAEFTEFVIKVSNPLGKHVLVDRVYRNCPLIIRGHCFPADLMLLPFDEFDVILGMDWLTLHDAVANYRRKIIELKCENGEILRIDSDESGELPVVISSMSAQGYVRKGCEAYLAYMLNTKVSELKIELVPVVCEYPNVFPEELPGLPPIREVELGIDLVPGTSPILIAPYRMAPIKLKELKA